MWWEQQVFEKRAFKQQSGGIALGIAPNADRVLLAWGLDLIAECSGVKAQQAS
jgi:hypothetical protein